MSHEDEKPPGQPLKPHQAALLVVMMSCFVLLFVAVAVHDLQVRKFFLAFLFSVVSLAWFGIVLIYFHIYRQVKSGKEIILRSVALPSPISPRIPFFVSFAVTCVLTLLVLGFSCFCYFELYQVFKTLSQKLFMAGFNLFFWVVTALVWYRLITTKQPPRVQYEPFAEQPEGVWPPAPRVAIKEDDD